MYDLIVIGGGPAGTAAAISAARSGARVLLLERGRFPRHKVCGEFVSSESLDLLGKLLDCDSIGVLRDALRVTWARVFLDGRVLSTPVEPAAASVARFELDKALWDSAERRGVDARQQVGVQNVAGSGPFFVTTPAGDFAARAVVNASGRWSNLGASAPANGHNVAKWIGLKAHFAESSAPASVDLYFFDGGYCGVQPVILSTNSRQPRVNACAMVRADVASTLPEVFQLHPALRQRTAHWQPLSDPVSVAPLLFGKPQPVRDGIFMVGDAAGFVDPFIGDGISLALRSGALAAECLSPFCSGVVSLGHAVHRYAEEYQRQFAPVFRSSSRIRRMLLLPRAVRSPLTSLLANTPAVTRYLVRTTR
jgi:flavin-dependent dehydrogenase